MNTLSNKPTAATFREIYIKILEHLDENGTYEGKTWNCYDLDFVLTNSLHSLIPIKKNWEWCFSELFDRFNPDFENPGEAYKSRPSWARKLEKEGGKFVYTYNERFNNKFYFEQLVKRLKGNLEREAIVTVWEKADLYLGKPRQRNPCTLTLHFMREHGKLSLWVNMRTSDVINLLPYDVVHHTFFLRMIAHHMKLEVGNFYFHASHFYCPKRRKMRDYLPKLIQELKDEDWHKVLQLTPFIRELDKQESISTQLIRFKELAKGLK